MEREREIQSEIDSLVEKINDLEEENIPYHQFFHNRLQDKSEGIGVDWRSFSSVKAVIKRNGIKIRKLKNKKKKAENRLTRYQHLKRLEELVMVKAKREETRQKEITKRCLTRDALFIDSLRETIQKEFGKQRQAEIFTAANKNLTQLPN